MKRTWIMRSIIMIAIGIVMIMCPVRYMGLLISALAIHAVGNMTRKK